MPQFLENPFTPKSALPKKRLFGGEEKVVKRQLSQKGQERINEAEKKYVKYGEYKILKKQVKFLEEVEKLLIEKSKEGGSELSAEEAKKKIFKGIIGKNSFERIETDNQGNIISIDFFDMGLEELPNLDDLKELQKLQCSWNDLYEMPNLDKNINLRELLCSQNNLRELPNLDNLTKLERLECSENNLDFLPNLKKLVNLKFLSCKANNLHEDEFERIASEVPENCELELPSYGYDDDYEPYI